MIDTNKEIEMYLNYLKTIWQKVKEKFKDEPVEAQVKAFERATTPIKFWLENGIKESKQEKTDNTLVDVAQKYGLIIDGEKLKIPKGGYDPGTFKTISSELENIGFKYVKGKGYFEMGVA